VKIPITVVHLKGAKLDGKGPLYLTGYGSYGYPYDISFNSNLFSMVDRGVVCAVAHIRGGGEMGKAWHDDGRMMHKKKHVHRFIASAEYEMAFGTDSGVYRMATTPSNREMVEWGMKPIDAIQAATIRAADLIGWSAKWAHSSRITLADVIAVSGDPLSDVHVLESVKFVMKNGAIVRNDFSAK